MNNKYIVRNNQIEEVWRVVYEENGFKKPLFIRGTEDEFRAYMGFEFGYVGEYFALTDAEVSAVKSMKIPIYLAPEIHE